MTVEITVKKKKRGIFAGKLPLGKLNYVKLLNLINFVSRTV